MEEATQLTKALWPPHHQEQVAEIWMNHNFVFATEDHQMGFLQSENGPCGILAAVFGRILIEMQWKDCKKRPLGLARALSGIIGTVRPTEEDPLWMVLPPKENANPVTWKGWKKMAVGSVKEGEQWVLENMPVFSSPQGGGLVSFVASLLLTRGIHRVLAEAQDGMGFVSFIGDDACHEQALLNLCLAGRAHCAVSDEAWPVATPKERIPMGLLVDERQWPVGQYLRCPAYPVWVVLSGGHYTTLWSKALGVAKVVDIDGMRQDKVELPPEDKVPGYSPEGDALAARGLCRGGCSFFGGDDGWCSVCSMKYAHLPRPSSPKAKKEQIPPPPPGPPPVIDTEEPEEDQDTFAMYHWNGYRKHSDPPFCFSSFTVSLRGAWVRKKGDKKDWTPMSEEAKKKDEERIAYKVKRIIARRVQEGGDKDQGPWEVSVVCEQNGGLEGVRPCPPGEKWRCRFCTLKDPIEWGAFNDRDAVVCKVCLKEKTVCGWCHWLPVEDLSAYWKSEYHRQYSPVVLRAIRTKWPMSDIDLGGHGAPPMFG